MLEHQTTSTEQPQSAANVRVTPEELAKALAALEARKEQSARETAGTIPIGEAVQQLGFDATAEELWAEVQAQRIRQQRPMGTRLPTKTRRLWLSLGIGILALVGFVMVSEEQRGNVSTITDVSPAVQYVTPPTPQTVVKTLAEVPNNGTFYCDEATAQELLRQSASADHVTVTEGRPYTGQQNDASWTFTKHDGKLYVHGYTAPRSPGAMQLGHIPIYNEELDATGAGGLYYSQPITLAVGTFRIDGYGEGGMTMDMTVSGVHPDGHFGDTW